MKKMVLFSLVLAIGGVLVSCVSTAPAVSRPPDISVSYEEALHLYNLGAIAYDAGNFSGALDYLNQAVPLLSSDPDGEGRARLKRAETYVALGNLESAADDVESVIALLPNSAGAHFERALINFRKGNAADAQTDLDAAITLDPNFARAYNLKGLIAKSEGDLGGALKAYDRAISIDGSYAPFYFNRAVVEVETGNYEAAINDYTEAIMKYPDTQNTFKAQAFCMRSELFLLLGNAKRAEIDKRQAQSLVPGACAEEETTKPKWGKGEIRD